MIKSLCATLLVVLFLTSDSLAAAPDIHVDPQVYTALESNSKVPVWIFLKDRDTKNQIQALDQLKYTYNARAIQRRLKRRTSPGLFDERDLPVAQSYITTLAQHVQRIRVRSRWLNAVSADVTAKQLAALARLPFVRSIQIVRRSQGVGLLDERKFETGETLGPGSFYGGSYDQLQTIDLPAVHQAGFTGQGIIIGVLDTGFKRSHVAFANPEHPLNVIAEYDFINDDPNTAPESGDDPNQHYHGSLILGTMAAYQPETYVGAAYQAAFILCKTEDITGEYQGEEDFYVAGLEFIEANGGDVATSSLTYLDWYTQNDMDGQTAVTSIGVNTATDNGVHCCTAVGNSGHDSDPNTSHLGAPADAFKVYSVGSVNIFGEISGFSSDGPTADGRTKPEVLAVGESTVSIDPFNDNGYTSASGTSLSTPLAAASIACVLQSDDTIGVDAMRDAFLFNSSYYLVHGTYDPLHVMGYGIIDAYASLLSIQPTTVVADSYNVSRGILSSGSLPDTFESDDSYLKFRPGLTLNSSEPPVWLEFESVLSTDVPSSLNVILEASANTVNLTQTIEMLNWNTGQYELVDAEASGFNSDLIVDIDLSNNISNYVQSGSGAVKTRIGWKATGIVLLYPWTISIDQVAWRFVN